MSRSINFPENIPVKTIFNKIDDCFQQVSQWEKMGVYDLCTEYKSKAVVLIELLEVAHCGSSGGVQTNFPKGRDGLKKRRDYLYEVLVKKE